MRLECLVINREIVRMRERNKERDEPPDVGCYNFQAGSKRFVAESFRNRTKQGAETILKKCLRAFAQEGFV